MTSTAEVAAGAKSVAEARPPGSAKDRALTAASAVVPTGAKSVGVGETSRQNSVKVEQLMQQLRKMGQERALRMLDKLLVCILERFEQ